MTERSHVVPLIFVLVSGCAVVDSSAPEVSASDPEALVVLHTDPIPTAAGTYVLRYAWDGLQRAFLLYLPPGYKQMRATQYPMIAMFHGGGQSAASFAGQPGMQQDLQTVVDAEGYVVVFLQAEAGPTVALPGSWEFDPSVRDDFGYATGVLDRLDGALNVDSTRVFAAGFSRGGAFAHHRGIRDPTRFRGIAAVEGFYAHTPDVLYISPAAQTDLSVFIVHQDMDPVVPYGGGSGYTSAADAYANWYANNRCTALSIIFFGALVDTKSTGCLPGGLPSIKLVTFHGAAHAWPAATTGYNTSAEMIAFFNAH